MALRLSVPAPLAHVVIKPEINPVRLQQWLMGLSTSDPLSSNNFAGRALHAESL